MAKKRKAAEPSLREHLRAVLDEAKENGWTINRIATESGVPQPMLQRFVTGTRDDLLGETIERLLDFFGMHASRMKPTRNRKPPR